jgi:hypothetical protein
MNTEELKEMIDGCIFDVPQGDCYLTMVKVGGEVSVSFEGDKDTIKACLLKLMKKYKDLAEVVVDAADAYIEEEE